jgi:hypothetical protein
MQCKYSDLRGRWTAGDRDRELALQLMFYAWMNWADPEFVTGLAHDPEAAVWHQTFAFLGGEESSDPEFLYVSGVMAALFPWELGNEVEWTQRAAKLQRRANELQPSGLSEDMFGNRGEYGTYFAHQLRAQRGGQV